MTFKLITGITIDIPVGNIVNVIERKTPKPAILPEFMLLRGANANNSTQYATLP